MTIDEAGNVMKMQTVSLTPASVPVLYQAWVISVKLGLLNSCCRLLCPLISSEVVSGFWHQAHRWSNCFGCRRENTRKTLFMLGFFWIFFFFFLTSLHSDYFVLGRSRFNLEFASLLSLQKSAKAFWVKSQTFKFVHAQKLASAPLWFCYSSQLYNL